MQEKTLIKNIESDPKYLELRVKRNRLGWFLTVLIMLAYYGFVALIAFDKPFLATPLGDGVTSIGVPIAMGLIVFTIVITLYYIYRANHEFDRLTNEILQEAGQ